MVSDSYCAYVDKGFRLTFTEQHGQVYFTRKPCCHTTNSNPILKELVAINSAEDLFKHPSINYFQKYVRDNKKLPKDCALCMSDEIKGVSSARTWVNSRDHEFKDFDINRLDIVLGNACNLACPFCSSPASSLINKLAIELGEENRPKNWKPYNNLQADSTKVSLIIADILKTYRVHTLKLIGGEPFLKENWDSIGSVLDTEVCKDITLEITTNGTIMNDKIINNLSKTKNAILHISVDSINENYNFIRWPHKWSKMIKNLEFLRDNCPDHVNPRISILVNIFNFEFLPQIEEFFKEYEHMLSYSLNIKPVDHLMNYQNLPNEIIEDVISKVKTPRLKSGLATLDIKANKQDVKKEFDVLLAQRKMKAEDVIGPQTREWLCL